MADFDFYEKHMGQMGISKDWYKIKNISANNLEIISPIKCDLTIGQSKSPALVDNGASANFMRPDIADKLGMPLHKLDTPLVVELADKTTRKCTDFVRAYTSADKDADSAIEFAITDMTNSRHEVFLGMPWLTSNKPEIDWLIRTIPVDNSGLFLYQEEKEIEANVTGLGKIEFVYKQDIIHDIEQAGTQSGALMLNFMGFELMQEKVRDPFTILDPTELLAEYADVMPDDLQAGIPPERVVDHMIDLEPGATPPFRQVYHLSNSELEELRTQLQGL